MRYQDKYDSKGPNLGQYKNSQRISDEIKKHKPNTRFQQAFINNKNELVIKTNNKNDEENLKAPWTDEAFGGTLELVKYTQKFYAAIKISPNKHRNRQ